MDIRIANIKDIEKILSLENQMFELHLKERPDWFKNTLDYNKNYDIIKNIIGNNNEEIFIAEDNNILIGLCIITIHNINNHHVFHDMKVIEIEDLIVDIQYRKKDIGKKLFEKIKIYAKEINAKFIELSTWEFNKNAKEFYEHLGMKTKMVKMEIRVE